MEKVKWNIVNDFWLNLLQSPHQIQFISTICNFPIFICILRAIYTTDSPHNDCDCDNVRWYNDKLNMSHNRKINSQFAVCRFPSALAKAKGKMSQDGLWEVCRLCWMDVYCCILHSVQSVNGFEAQRALTHAKSMNESFAIFKYETKSTRHLFSTQTTCWISTIASILSDRSIFHRIVKPETLTAS